MLHRVFTKQFSRDLKLVVRRGCFRLGSHSDLFGA